MCVQGARWVQKEVLDKYKDSDLKVYVVWQPMLPTDDKTKLAKRQIVDDRSVQFWDPKNVVGRWFTEHAEGCDTLGDVAWDAYYLFSPVAEWGESVGIFLLAIERRQLSGVSKRCGQLFGCVRYRRRSAGTLRFRDRQSP